jgi:hypothetical protein
MFHCFTSESLLVIGVVKLPVFSQFSFVYIFIVPDILNCCSKIEITYCLLIMASVALMEIFAYRIVLRSHIPRFLWFFSCCIFITLFSSHVIEGFYFVNRAVVNLQKFSSAFKSCGDMLIAL